ncbi:MAG TPA: ISKra4 family transposase [Anaerolineales bacterium]
MEFSTEMVEKMADLMVAEIARVIGPEEAIMAVEDGMRELLRQVGKRALGKYVSQAEVEPEAKVACACGDCAGRLAKREAKAISVFGKIRYERGYYLCRGCGQGQCPLDRRMGIEPGQVTPGLAKLLALAGVEVAFEEAGRWMEQFLLFRVSDNTIRKETERFGELQAQREASWQAHSQAEPELQQRLQQLGRKAGRLYASIDGAMAPLQEEWRELKSIAWYQVEALQGYQTRRHHGTRVGEQSHLQAQAISYHCQFQEAEQFGPFAWATGWKRQADLYEQLVFVCDGAQWIWKLVERYFPGAVQIVDWYHASQYLTPIAEAAWEAKHPAGQAWLEQARTSLWNGQIADLVQDCRVVGQAHAQAREAVQRAVTYFSHNEKRMDYARFRAEGYLIGSGTIESGCKQIVSLRLKRAGARWTEAGAVQTAKARAAWLSGDWDILSAKRAALPLAV